MDTLNKAPNLISAITSDMTKEEAVAALKFLLEQADFSDTSKEIKSQCFSIVFILIDSLK